ncbi:MAG TPA: ABC transporter ATP-binding protein [Candidatus Bathyarchaeia archaeon]|nr:ABC transporter ATP-binding protein [Candidatus Bathyarchaeia archaeon]
MNNLTLASIQDLRTQFETTLGVVQAVDGVSFDIQRGETLGLVGESGSGKSVTALSIMRLVHAIGGHIVSGRIEFNGLGNLLEKDEGEMRGIRGKHIAMSFQDPMTYLNPVLRIGDQIAETISLHQSVTRRQAWDGAIEAMNLVGIPSPQDRVNDYPHQFSGGMRQRLLLAIAVACKPKLLIADEPTTALDVIVQDEILELLKDLKAKVGTTVMIITHDLGMVAELADRVVVMYAGKVLEIAETAALFKKPLNPYTEALIQSIPRIEWGKRRLRTIEGNIADPIKPPPGCRFSPRCQYAQKICFEQDPMPTELKPGHWTACHLASQVYP